MMIFVTICVVVMAVAATVAAVLYVGTMLRTSVDEREEYNRR